MTPRRIVSLVPSLTELVFALGSGDMLLGRTRFCEEPANLVGRVPIIGGTKNPNIGRIRAAEPDLVLANKEENRREDVEALRAAGLRVLLTDPNTVDDAITMVVEIGTLLDRRDAALAIATDTRGALLESPPVRPVRVLVAIWVNPLMALGTGAYGHDLLQRVGVVNVLRAPRYPELSLAEARALAPEIILLPDEPFPFSDAHATEFSAIAPARVIDGKLLWWYGPRMPASIRTLRALIREMSC